MDTLEEIALYLTGSGEKKKRNHYIQICSHVALQYHTIGFD